MKIPVSASIIIPEVEITEEQFDFGNITTLGNAVSLSMHLANRSLIPAELVLDLRGSDENPNAIEGIDCLEMFCADDSLEDSILHSVQSENEEQQ